MATLELFPTEAITNHFKAGMQRVFSERVWADIAAIAKRAKHRKAAIAYVTKNTIGLRRGDTLIVDASLQAIGCGATDAKLLRALYRKGVKLFDCPGLHAKVLLLDSTAVVGSANMSQSSSDALVELAVATDHATTVAGVASFLEQITTQSLPLSRVRLDELCQIKVIRAGLQARRLAKRQSKSRELDRITWVVGVHELEKDPSPDEQRRIARAVRELQERDDALEEPDWVQWGTKSSFARRCRPGDVLIQLWRSAGTKNARDVYSPTPVLLRQRTPKHVRFFLGHPLRSPQRLPLSAFKRLMNRVGYAGTIGANMVRALDSEVADAILRGWRGAKGKQ